MHINRNKCANKQFELFYSLFNPNIWLKMPYNYIVKLTIFTIISRALLSVTFSASTFFGPTPRIWEVL